jgi:CO/xanthine dehydrogenase FAD-binding subunit
MSAGGWSLVGVSTLDELLEHLARRPETRVLAGGTDLLVQKRNGRLAPGPCVDIRGLGALAGIERLPDGGWSLGAAASYSELLALPDLCNTYPMLARAARATGGWAIRNAGTLGGNLANASPAADSPPALLCYEARVELARLGGRRDLPLERFFLEYRRTALEPGELITRILLPARDVAPWREEFVKVGTREAQSIAKVGLAMAVRVQHTGAGPVIRGARLAAGAVAPVPLRLTGCEALLEGHALDEARIAAVLACLLGEIRPIDDLRSTEAYRRHAARAVLERFLRDCLEDPRS